MSAYGFVTLPSNDTFEPMDKDATKQVFIHGTDMNGNRVYAELFLPTSCLVTKHDN